jgi:hypothetical protein
LVVKKGTNKLAVLDTPGPVSPTQASRLPAAVCQPIATSAGAEPKPTVAAATRSLGARQTPPGPWSLAPLVRAAAMFAVPRSSPRRLAPRTQSEAAP